MIYNDIMYMVEHKGGANWRWVVFYPKKLGEFTNCGIALNEAEADQAAHTMIDSLPPG